jgi:hypothetical protein
MLARVPCLAEYYQLSFLEFMRVSISVFVLGQCLVLVPRALPGNRSLLAGTQ